MSADLATLVSDNLDVWTSAIERKSGAGRGGAKISHYGIDRLRALILDFAVRGRLVPQDSNGPSGVELLQQIEAEKRRLVKSGAAKRLAPVEAPAHWPFAIPDTWAWSQIGTITNYGETEKANPGDVDDDTWVLELEDVERGSSRLLERVRHSSRKFQSQKNRFAPGDVIYGKLRPYLDKVLVADEGGVCTTEMVPVRGYFGLEPAYLRLFLKSPFFIELADGSTHGMNLPRLGTDKAREAPIALPPLTEQRRIVAKVAELMALCDALEMQSASALEAHQTLVETLLATLVNAADSAGLAREWSRLKSHFDTLFTTDASIEALRQTVLELAVRGKLVDQEANDRHSRPPSPKRGKAVEPPFPIPSTWLCLPLASLGELRGGGTPSKGRVDYWDGALPWVSPKDMKKDHLSDAQLHVSEGALAASAIKLIPPHSVLFVVRGMILAHSFPVGISTVDLTINQDMKALVLDDPEMDEYILRALKGLKRNVLGRIERSGHGTCRFDSKDYSSLPIPIPPLAEQKRIVTKVDELMGLCDALKARLADAAQTRKHLADAIVERAAA